MKTIAFSLFAFALAAAGASAQQATTAPESNPCQQDVATLCKGVAPGAEHLADCLTGNLDKIQNSQCKNSITQLSRVEQQAKSSCASDLQTKCANQNGAGMIDCLHQNASSLSAGCKSALPK